MILQILLYGGVDIVIGQLRCGTGGGQALVLSQLHLRVEVNEGGEGVPLGADGQNIQLRRAGHADVLLPHGLHQRHGESAVYRVLIKHIIAVLFFHLLPGGQGTVLLLKQSFALLIRVIERLFPCILFHLDGQYHPAVFFVFPMQQHTVLLLKM